MSSLPGYMHGYNRPPGGFAVEGRGAYFDNPSSMPYGVRTPDNPMGAIPSPAVPVMVKPPAIIPIRFWTKYKKPAPRQFIDPSAPPAMMEEEDWVEWVKKGDREGSTTAEAIKRLCGNSDKELPPRVEWMVIGPFYEAWKRGEGAPVIGQPLFAWSGCSRELAAELKKFNIHSVEDLAQFPDHQITRIPIQGFRDLRRKAQLTIEARSISDVGDALAQRDRALEEERNARLSLEDQVRALQAGMNALKGNMANAAATLGGPSEDDEFTVGAERGASLAGARTVEASSFKRKKAKDIDELIQHNDDFVDLGGASGKGGVEVR